MTDRRGAGGPSGATRVVGVMGDPIAHSLSPLLHNTAFGELGLDWVMVAFPVVAGATATAVAALRAMGIAGMSVTMPHKSAAARLVDRLSPAAERLDAVNSLCLRKGELVGENTDGQGFLAAVREEAGLDPAGRRCLVVGAGGAARAVVLALATAGAADVAVVNRTPATARQAAALAGPVGRVAGAAEAAQADLVVNATPAGMAGSAAESAPLPLDPGLLGPGQVVVDLVYHPPVTPWLEAATGRGATAVGGLGMLVHQAAAQLTLWTGAEPPLAAMLSAARAAAAPPGPPG